MAVPPDLEAEVQSLSEATLFGISPITQRAALAVMPLLEPGNSEASRYGARLAALLRGLEGGTGVVRAILPEAGMFALVDVAPVDGLTFGEQLLEEYGFSVLPGEAFGSELRSFIRVGLLAEPAEMEAAGRAIVACARSMSAVATNDDDAGTSGES
jgi:aspartate/methionine/tyrosine aminotransferase